MKRTELNRCDTLVVERRDITLVRQQHLVDNVDDAIVSLDIHLAHKCGRILAAPDVAVSGIHGDLHGQLLRYSTRCKDRSEGELEKHRWTRMHNNPTD